MQSPTAVSREGLFTVHVVARAITALLVVGLLTGGLAAATDLAQSPDDELRPAPTAVAAGDLAAAEVVDGATEASQPRVAPGGPSEGPRTASGTPLGQTRNPDRARGGGPSGSGVWALVIGVDNYQGTTFDLRAGKADARDMDAVLDRYGVPASQRRVLLDGQATLAAAHDSLDWLARNAGPDSTVVIFFSGHVREVVGDRDGDGEEIDEAILLPDGGELFDGDVARALDGMRTDRVWLVIAGCYGGGFDDAMAPGRVLTGAAPEGELAYENDRFGRTYLVEYMIRRAMLEGSAPTIQDAFAQAASDLESDYPHRLPVQFDQSDGPLALTGAVATPSGRGAGSSAESTFDLPVPISPR